MSLGGLGVPHPIDRFAALAAHSLNDACRDGFVRVDPGALYVLWLEALATRHAPLVLQHARYAARMDADEAAERYFRTTLERGLFQAAQAQCTVAHTLFLALCRRGGTDWAEARIERQPGIGINAVALHAPNEWRSVAQKLAACDQTVAQSNAATSHRKRFGALYLVCGVMAVPLPEQMSVWDAVCCAPRRLEKLDAGPAFNTFCSVFINALRTTNRPFQEILSLGRGLCPFDWLDLPVNQVRGVGRFLSALESTGGGDGEAAWAQAWDQSPVPGYPSCTAFRASDLGGALRAGPMRLSDNTEIESLGEEDSQLESLLKADEFAAALLDLNRRNLLTSEEADLLSALYRGETLEGMRAKKLFGVALTKLGSETALRDLQLRIESAR